MAELGSYRKRLMTFFNPLVWKSENPNDWEKNSISFHFRHIRFVEKTDCKLSV